MYVCLLRTGALHPLCIFHGVLSGLVSPYSNNTHTYIAWRHGHIHTRWVGYARWEKTQEKSHMNETAISISPSFFYHIFPWQVKMYIIINHLSLSCQNNPLSSPFLPYFFFFSKHKTKWPSIGRPVLQA